MKVFNINDTYFKYQKCLSGITYQFVNQLDNIYDKNLMVGTNYCIYCMYNEFDIINNFMINLYQVDVCSTINLDLTKRYYDIDGAYLRTGHRVLLVNQTDPVDNDIYVVDSRGFLNLSDELATTGKTWRYKAYVKLGGNKGKQFHLKNSGNRFPLKGERKYFLDGHGYIVKSLFNYDLFDTGPILPKIIFTDYELARISVNKNYELYEGFLFETGTTVDIQYHGGSYLINIDNVESNYTSTGIVSGTTIYNYNNFPLDGFGYETHVEAGATFCSNASVYDYVKLEISGDTSLSLKTFIKETGTTFIVISDYIPDNILNDYYTGNTSTYTLTNLMFATTGNTKEVTLESFYAKYFDIDSSDFLYPIPNPNNMYFDYDGLKFVINSTQRIFNTNNHYIKYQLYEHLNEINSYLFNSGYSFLINYPMNAVEFSTEYYDGRNLTSWNPIVYPDTYGDTKGTLIKIKPYTPSTVNYFKNHTYVNITNSTGKYKTLIVDLLPDDYFVIETYKSNSGLTISGIETIYTLKDISDILYDVYINDETPSNTDYFRVRDEDMKRNICNGYADFISQDIGIISNVTAFLMQDEQHKFILKLYDPENYSNGGVPRKPVVVTKLNETHTSTSAILPGEITSDGGTNITGRGICWSTSSFVQNICVQASTYTSGVGPFSSNITGLTPESWYYYKAYATNVQGTSYGEPYSFFTSTAVYTGATVTTNSASATSHKITVDASVIDRGYCTILTRGIVYKIGISAPTIADSVVVFTPEPGTIGSYTLDLTGLTHNQMYSYNAFAENICGVTYGIGNSISTLYPYAPVLDTIGWNSPTTYNSIDVLCNLIDNDGSLTDPEHGVDELGVVWSTDPYNDPTTGNTVQPFGPYPYSLGPYIVYLTGLTFNTTYYFRAYAINTLYSGSTTAYGPVKSVATLPLPVTPTVQISSVLSFGTYHANVSNLLLSNGNSPIVSEGLYISTLNPPTISDPFWSATGTTNWHTNLTGLTLNTSYYLMAAATNLYGLTGYSSVSGFTTLPIQTLPTVTLSFISSGSSTGIFGGVITSDGNAIITSKGLLYSTSPTPTSPIWYEGTGSASWTSTITGLTNLTTYYVRAYATNSIGTNYSADIQFTTASGFSKPSFSVSSPVISNIGTVNADVTSQIVSDGGASVTSRGLQYSGTTIPSLLNWNGGTGTGSWTSTLTGLTLGGNYYVFAHATNSEGTTYTPSVNFSTLSAVLPAVVINSVSDISITGATINSEVISDGYATVTARGTTGNTIGLWPYATGGVGAFSLILTGLTPGTAYTGQSYAINSVGTGWSNNIYFSALYLNDANVKLFISSVSSVDPLVYQIGTSTTDIVTTVAILQGNVPTNQLWSGNTTFTASSTTGLTWGLGITSANNASSPYTYTPVIEETPNFVAIESCGTPSEIKDLTVQVSAVYPFLTCNRVPSVPPILTDRNMRIYCAAGNFYLDTMPPNNEPMLKKVETYSSIKTYAYTIGATDNLVYFAHPSSYGIISSIKANGVNKIPTTYLNVEMASSGLVNNWTGILYNVYAFQVPAMSGPIYIVYEF